jgi:hypothetical protein
MHATRSSIDQTFSAPVEVQYNGIVNLEIVSSWLSPDEKTMFLIANNIIYKCTRKSVNDAFSFPEVFTSEFKNFYFIAGLSFKPDKKTMVLYQSGEIDQSILIYQLKTGKAW